MSSRKGVSLLVMGVLSLALVSFLDVLIAGREAPSLGLVIASWTVDLALLVIIAASVASDRACLGLAALVNGALCFVAFLAKTVLPASAAAPFEPGEPIERLDLTLPWEPRLREALASAYFSIAIIIGGVIFFAAAYFLLHRDDGTHHPP